MVDFKHPLIKDVSRYYREALGAKDDAFSPNTEYMCWLMRNEPSEFQEQLRKSRKVISSAKKDISDCIGKIEEAGDISPESRDEYIRFMENYRNKVDGWLKKVDGHLVNSS